MTTIDVYRFTKTLTIVVAFLLQTSALVWGAALFYSSVQQQKELVRSIDGSIVSMQREIIELQKEDIRQANRIENLESRRR